MTEPQNIITSTFEVASLGGILRCGECGAEQPLGDAGGHLRRGWPKCCGLTMTWVTLKQLAAERREVPDDCELVAVVHEGWRVETGKLCANRTKGVTCRKPSVAELNRARTRWAAAFREFRSRDAWYPYCPDHLYANWVENGQVWHWILREKADLA